MTSPQGKRNVYFTSHPDDHERFFEQISDEVLKITNCTIWYNTDENYENNDTELGQKNINLIIVPITTKLLTNPECRTIKIDIPYAKKRKIPILPLMQEKGLDELFNRYFKNIHYLDPNAKKENAISYDEKLKNYLNSILVGDELARKIRAAFDAYIFLSYRKKDWEYANELMHLIHKNDLCRDIAIWYDQYITPGTRFPRAIKTALNKSKLFAMVVTPNLVTDNDNYVKTEEFPAAINVKPIIPAEMEKTDHEKLSEWYPGIPDCVDARDEIALSKGLESALINIAHMENDNDPLHNYFIGLAYLDGIDVEVNHERALALITSAAEANENKVPEAIEKLVSMFKEGHGVKRDYKISVEWQQKLVDYWEEKYRNTNNIKDYRKLSSELCNLGDQLRIMKKFNEAKNRYLQMLELFNSLSYKNKRTKRAQQTLSVIYERLGAIYELNDDLEKANEFFKKCVTVSEQIAKRSHTVKTRRDLATSYEWLGYICKKLGDFEEAERYHGKSLELREQLLKDNESAEERRSLWGSYIWVGNICEERGKFKEAQDFYQKALSLSEQFNKETKSAESQRILFVTYERLGSLCKDQVQAEKFYQKCLTLSKWLIEKTDAIEDRRRLSISYEKLGDICYSLENWEGAKDLYLKDFELSKKLEEEIGTTEARRDLSTSYFKLGNLSKAQGDRKEAEDFYLKSLEIREMLYAEKANIEDQRELAVTYVSLGDIYKDNNELELSENFYRKGLLLSEQLVKKFQKTTVKPELYDDLAVSYIKLAIIKNPYNRELLEKALQIYTDLEIQYPQVTRYFENRDSIKYTLESMN